MLRDKSVAVVVQHVVEAIPSEFGPQWRQALDAGNVRYQSERGKCVVGTASYSSRLSAAYTMARIHRFSSRHRRFVSLLPEKKSTCLIA